MYSSDSDDDAKMDDFWAFKPPEPEEPEEKTKEEKLQEAYARKKSRNIMESMYEDKIYLMLNI